MQCSEKVTVDITKTFVLLIDRQLHDNQHLEPNGGDKSRRNYRSVTLTIKAVFFCPYNITFDISTLLGLHLQISPWN